MLNLINRFRRVLFSALASRCEARAVMAAKRKDHRASSRFAAWADWMRGLAK